ncbi:hypothetical protein Efla_002610 [Eimeria flavescens]
MFLCPRLQIFGRLAGSSGGSGSALVSPYTSPAAAAKEILAAEAKRGEPERTGLRVREWLALQQPSVLLQRPLRGGQKKENKLQPWERLFVNEESLSGRRQRACMQQWQGLPFADFCARMQGLSFMWPVAINTGQAPLNIPLVPVANAAFLHACRRMRSVPRRSAKEKALKFSWQEVNEFVEKEKISIDALAECVFRCLLVGAGSTAAVLHREDVLRCVWRWAPADGVVDWEQFLFFMDEFPSDGLEAAVD